MGRAFRRSAVIIFGLLFVIFSLISALGAYALCLLLAIPQGFAFWLMPIAFFVFLFFLFAVANRTVTLLVPLPQGMVEPGTREEVAMHISVLFYIMIFYVPIYSHLIIPSFTRLFYRLLGSQIGRNSYPSATHIGYPFYFFKCKDNVIFGEGALITPHVSEKGRLGAYFIDIGHNVTIGAHSVILAGVTIGDNAVIAAGAVVPKFTQIAAGEVWGGVPAKKITPKE